MINIRQLLSRVKGKLNKILPFKKQTPASQPTDKPTEDPLKSPEATGEPPTKDVPAFNEHSKAVAAPPTTPDPQQVFSKSIQSKTTTTTLPITLQNNTKSSNVYAYITGQAIDNSFKPVLLQSDGQSLYYPSNPSKLGSPLTTNCAISLGSPGSSRTVTIPHLAGGRIWFSVDAQLTFLLNPSPNGIPGLVEPSVTNQSDPNYAINWAFCEFTFNASQMYANISFVDFVSLPISLSLTNTSNQTQNVPGLPSGGATTIAAQLVAQSAKDNCQGWKNLPVYSSSGKLLRILSPNNGLILRPNDFAGYFEPYVSRVLAKYTAPNSLSCTLSSQKYTGSTSPTSSTISLGGEVFPRPSTADIFTCSTGPFATGSNALRNQLIPQIAAAFNRSSLLVSNSLPSALSTFYGDGVTNHYSRIVHGVVSGGRGYAFPYDDVPPSSGGDQSGFVNDGAPKGMVVAVGSL